MQVLITTSGAGGHLFCGLSIANELKKRISGIKIYFLGSDNNLARKLIEFNGFNFYKISASGLFGKNIFKIIKFIFSQILGFIQSGILFMRIKPEVVISTGGFSSMGTVLWSSIFNRPCIIHEQNLIPGKVNRLSGYFAKKILLSFNDTKKYFQENKCIVTGMPMRFTEKIDKTKAKAVLGLSQSGFTVLIMGGSMGAHGINKIVAEMLPKIGNDIQFVHLTGKIDFEFMKNLYKKYNINTYVEQFSDKMDIIYSASDLVVSRAGSGSISEITYFGLPSILIPYPYSRDKHQYKNADILAKDDAAIVVHENDLSAEKLYELIENTRHGILAGMAEKSRKLAMPNAVQKITDEIMELIRLC